MRRSFVICTVLVAAIAVSATATAAPQAFWTVSKADRMVTRDALLALRASQRAVLEAELTRGAGLFAALQLAAREEGDPQAGAVFAGIEARYVSALRKLTLGLSLTSARCKGSGPGRLGRYERFRCSVTSETLSVPEVTLLPAPAGRLPAVVEGAPRTVGPFHAELSVRVTGASTLTFREVLARAVVTASPAGIE